MNDYMRENKIEPVPPQLKPTEVAAKAASDAGEEEVGRKPAKGARKHDS